MMSVALPRAGHLFHRDDAPFELSAALVLELDGGVRNLEVRLQHMVQLLEDAGAL